MWPPSPVLSREQTHPTDPPDSEDSLDDLNHVPIEEEFEMDMGDMLTSEEEDAQTQYSANQ